MAIDEVHRAIGQCGPGKCRDGFDHVPKFSFLALRFPNTVSQDPPQDKHGNRKAKCSEPKRFPPGRQNPNLQRYSSVTPVALMASGLRSKDVVSRGESAVGHGVLIGGRFIPLMIYAVQPVTIESCRRAIWSGKFQGEDILLVGECESTCIRNGI